jgi:hypothetical protein
MTSILKVDTIQDQSGNNIINENADTITIGASGDTIDVPGTEVKTNKISPTSGTTLTLGDSGDTITIPSGATITNSGTATGFGKVLQVVTATDSTQRNSSSTSFVTLSNTLSVNITPSAASSKIFVTTTFTAYNNVAGKSSGFTIFRDSTDLGSGTWGMIAMWDETNRTIGASMSMSVLDSPSSTSELTYQLYAKTESGGAVYINYDNIKASITAFEIAG